MCNAIRSSGLLFGGFSLEGRKSGALHRILGVSAWLAVFLKSAGFAMEVSVCLLLRCFAYLCAYTQIPVFEFSHSVL